MRAELLDDAERWDELVLARASVEKRLRGLSPEDVMRNLSPEDRARLRELLLKQDDHKPSRGPSLRPEARLLLLITHAATPCLFPTSRLCPARLRLDHQAAS